MRLATKRDFDSIFAIMEQSFPRDEYRSREGQQALFDNDNYSCYVFENEAGELIAFVSVWQIEGYIFVEHLAVAKACRGSGIGGKLLQELMLRYSLPLCLEVELPENELCRRRIAFYERHGFYYNDYPYVQPAFSATQAPVPLRIMTTAAPLNPSEFSALQKIIYKEIYHQC